MILCRLCQAPHLVPHRQSAGRKASARPAERQAHHRTRLLGLLLLALTVFSPGVAAAETANGVGILVDVSAENHTAVVEIAEGSRYHTVGGKVVDDALLLRGGARARLDAFLVGETVRVVWRTSEQGEEIVSLWSNGPPPTLRRKPVAQPRISPPAAVTADHGVVIGVNRRHIIGKKETLLDIARKYDLGYNEMADLYPQLDPWIPPAGKELIIPLQRILPDSPHRGVVINVPELRLYYFGPSGKEHPIKTYPIGIGDDAFPTPMGTFVIGSKRTNPTWYIPPSLRHKYRVTSIPPGPDNPLGDYWLGLKNTMYGIHGTDIPWSVGRLVTHGCIRLYPEDISRLYNILELGTVMQLVYQPVKVALVADRLLIEVHRDVYNLVPDFARYSQIRIASKGLWQRVDRSKFRLAIEQQNGLPVDITKEPAPGRPY